MAEVLIGKIEFIEDNPYGDYVAGDIIEIYFDDTTVVPAIVSYIEDDGLVCYHNGSPISSGAYVDTDSSILTKTPIVSLCAGTQYLLMSYGNFLGFPYAYYAILANHYSCAVNPPTCDLIIVGTPQTTSATDATTADGVIVVNATSSNSIQYGINVDFVYGAGQTSGTFSGLLPGQYRIFLRDSANCGANVLVTVGASLGYGAIYRVEYDDLAGNKTKVDITKRDYTGSVTEIKGGSNPVQIGLSGEGETDKFKAVLASTCTLNLTSETDGFFSTLYTNDRNLYRVEYYKDFGSGYTQLWTGKLLPFNYQETVKSPPYYISVVASCGLPELKNEYLIQKDGQKLYGKVSLIKLVAHCLSFLKLGLNIRVACNLYATGMDATDADDPFDQAYVDYELFYLATEQPSIHFVLTSILEAFNVRIIQWENKWNIVRVEELGDTYAYREFDQLGDYSSNGTYDPVIDVNYPSTNGLMWESFPNKEIRQGYGTIKINYRLGLKPNIFDNGDFRLKSVYVGNNQYSFTINKDGFTLVNSTYPLSESFEKIDDGNVAYKISGGQEMITDANGGEAYLQSAAYNVKMGSNNQIKINIRYKVDRVAALFGGAIHQIEVPYVKVRMKVTYGSLYLQGDGTWSSTDSTVDFFTDTFNEYIESEIVAQQPTSGTPQSGMNMDIKLYHAYGYFAQFKTLAALKAFSTYSGSAQVVPTGYKTELRDSLTVPGSYVYYYELEENPPSASGYDVVQPDDYHASNNPRRWVLKSRAYVGTVVGANVFRFAIDRIQGTYLTDGKESIDTIIRKATAEPLNNDVFEKDIIIGSYSNLIVTETNFSISLGFWFPDSGGGISISTTSTLSADLIYAGWLRDSSGTGYEFWVRDGVSESAKLHAIWLTSYASQYSRAWELIRGSVISKTEYFGLLNVLNDPNNSDKVYMPISLTIDDFRNSVSGEFLELVGITGGAGFDNPGRPFTSGFSSGFGGSGFN